ncbi:MAG: hypothetical protein H0X47_12975 [Nitrospirales bacterium]|nr:hypothetical protein [Nitrospirales bacterium]
MPQNVVAFFDAPHRLPVSQLDKIARFVCAKDWYGHGCHMRPFMGLGGRHSTQFRQNLDPTRQPPRVPHEGHVDAFQRKACTTSGLSVGVSSQKLTSLVMRSPLPP